MDERSGLSSTVEAVEKPLSFVLKRGTILLGYGHGWLSYPGEPTPRFKDYDYSQSKFLPVSFDKQILPGTFEYSLTYLIDHELNLSVFHHRYANDEGGRPAYDPAILLKSRGSVLRSRISTTS